MVTFFILRLIRPPQEQPTHGMLGIEPTPPSKSPILFGYLLGETFHFQSFKKFLKRRGRLMPLHPSTLFNGAIIAPSSLLVNPVRNRRLSSDF